MYRCSELWVNRKKAYRTWVNYVHPSKVSPEHTTVASWEHVLVWCMLLGQSARWASFPLQWNSSCQISSCLSPKWVPLKVSTAWPHFNSLHITEAVLKSMCEKQTVAQVSSFFTFRCPEQAVSPPVRCISEKPGKKPKKQEIQHQELVVLTNVYNSLMGKTHFTALRTTDTFELWLGQFLYSSDKEENGVWDCLFLSMWRYEILGKEGRKLWASANDWEVAIPK